MARLVTLVTDQGTATTENVLCSLHDSSAARARRETDPAEDIAMPPAWVDCTGNPEVACIECGAR